MYKRARTCSIISNLVIVPNRDPRELLVAGNKIQVGAVGCKSLAVVVQSVDVTIRLWDTANAVTPAIFAVLVLVNVVSEVDDIVYRVLHYD